MDLSADYLGYPALPRCMILESSYSQRTQVLKSLKTVNLFQEVIEARSVKDGIEKLRNEDYDLCIIGSSVSKETTAEFLKQSVNISRNRDCGFVKLVQEKDVSILMAELPSIPHGYLEYPCTSQKFFDGLVLAVVRANANSPWTRLKKEQDEKSESEPKNKLATQRLQDIKSTFVDLQHIVQGYIRGDYGLDDEGHPDAAAIVAIAAATEKFLGSHQQSKSLEGFKNYFNAALTIWFEDLVRYNVDDATRSLKQRLQAYKSLTSQ